MTDHKGRGDRNAPSTRDLLDAYFDGELDRAGKGRLHEALRADPVLAEEFSRTSEAVSMLRQSASNGGLEIDLTERILTRSEQGRGYLSKRGRRFVFAGRSAVALAAMVMVAGVVVWVRLTPPELRLSDRERPIGTLLESGNADAANLRLVPPEVQKDLADSVDKSKAERRIVFYDLRPDAAQSFSLFGGNAAAAGDGGAVARLPMFARAEDIERQRALALREGPLPMGGQAALSVAPTIEGDGWWGRPAEQLLLRSEIVRGPDGVWLLLRPEPLPADQADRDRE